MEATGVYWRPVYYGLEDRFGELWLVNAHHVKNVPGRKTDMADAEWLADVAAHGMIRPSFVPPPEIRAVRELTRYRKTQIVARSQEIQRLERRFQDAGFKLTSVASTVWSKSSRLMTQMLIAGEVDPVVLAELAQGKMRSKIPALTEALESRWAAHHQALARQIVAHIEFLDATIDTLTSEIVERLVPFHAAVELLKTIPGISDHTAQTIIAEIGIDMTRFPTAGHLAAWAGVAPATHESAGKHRPAGTRHGSRHLRTTLIEAAHAAARTKATFLPPATAASPRGAAPTKPPSPPPTPSSWPCTTCSSPARSTTTSAPTSSPNAPTPPAASNATSPSSKPPATPSSSPQPPDLNHTPSGYARTGPPPRTPRAPHHQHNLRHFTPDADEVTGSGGGPGVRMPPDGPRRRP